MALAAARSCRASCDRRLIRRNGSVTPRRFLCYEAWPGPFGGELPLAHAVDLPSEPDLGTVFPPYRPIHEFPGPYVDAGQAEIAAWPVEGGLIRAAVQGFLRPADALALYELAWFAPGDVLELGSAWGLSAGILCRAMRNRNRPGTAVSIEIDPGFQRLTKESVAAAGLQRWHDMQGGDAGPLLARLAAARRQFGFVFIDHDHGYAAVRVVCDLLPGILPPGGYALFHDFNDSRNRTGEYGVYRAVAEMTAGAAMRFAGVIGCCALVQKTG